MSDGLWFVSGMIAGAALMLLVILVTVEASLREGESDE